jgi:hypothetical protein
VFDGVWRGGVDDYQYDIWRKAMDHREQTHHKEEMEHPKGALILILVYLLAVILLWTHTYLRLWIKG